MTTSGLVQSEADGLHFHVHMVSDSTGETLMAVMRASVAQFPGVHPIEHLFALVRSPRQMDRVLDHIEAHPGVVMFTGGQGWFNDGVRAGLAGLRDGTRA